MNTKEIIIDGEHLTINEVIEISRHNAKVKLSEKAVDRVKKSRAYVDSIVDNEKTVYGITTGFGKFSDVTISKEESKALQRNLIISHSCGVGNHFSIEISRAILLLRANALLKGFSGIRLETIESLLALLNNNITPAIPEKGSLGASGDLAPLSHMVLTLIGEGECYFEGSLISSIDALKKCSLTPVELTSKEGLALINGTQVMTAVGVFTVYEAINLIKLSDISASLTIEALNGITDAFLPVLHEVRPHKGQIDTAKNLLTILKDSQCTTNQGEIRVQDAYSLRCAPQVHGASKDAIKYVIEKIEIEINSVTDNPIIVPDEDLAISCGNFHGQPMALAFDFLGIALAELANISERRIERLVNPALSGLPAFLTENGGINSGFMIAQYSAAALVSENKVLAHPASVDSIPSSANQEDHVSMGTIAARKARDICFNVSQVIAIELLAACQGIDMNELNKGKNLGTGTTAAYKVIRNKVDYIKEDVIMYKLFDKTSELILNNTIVEAVEKATGNLYEY